jgi:hypothetical protein
MRHRFVIPVAVATAVLLVCVPASSQEKPAHEQPSKEQMDEMMKKWQESMSPGAPHKVLEDMVGEWDVETRTWMNGPTAPPTVARGTATMTMTLGGRFLHQEMSGEMMGMPFQGIGYTGYDNFKKVYAGFWIDNSSTAIFTMQGQANEDNTIFTMEGKMDDPVTGEKDKPVRYITRVENKDKHVFEIHDLGIPGGVTKVVELVYTRKK